MRLEANDTPKTNSKTECAPVSTSGRPTRVMIVEDSVVVSERLVALVSSVQNVHVVGQARDGYSAQEMFRSFEPDAVVLDIQLPGIDGLGLLEEFKASRPECLIMILTTYAFEEFRQRCLALGAAHFFDKATQFDQIPRVLKAMRDNEPSSLPTSA